MLGIPMVMNYWEAYGPFRVSDDHWSHHKACAVKVNFISTYFRRIIMIVFHKNNFFSPANFSMKDGSPTAN